LLFLLVRKLRRYRAAVAAGDAATDRPQAASADD
jgi:hypothetical protein